MPENMLVIPLLPVLAILHEAGMLGRGPRRQRGRVPADQGELGHGDRRQRHHGRIHTAHVQHRNGSASSNRCTRTDISNISNCPASESCFLTRCRAGGKRQFTSWPQLPKEQPRGQPRRQATGRRKEDWRNPPLVEGTHSPRYCALPGSSGRWGVHGSHVAEEGSQR